MKAFQLFRHRASRPGIHLLCDPFPERLNFTSSLFTRAENLSAQREYVAPTRQKFSGFKK